MSKWALLKAHLGGKRDNASQASIHRFEGFKMFSSKKVIWQGFVFHREIERCEGDTVEDVLNSCVECCKACLIEADSAEVKVSLKLKREEYNCVVQLVSLAQTFKEDEAQELSFEFEAGMESVEGEDPQDYTLQFVVRGKVFQPLVKRSTFWSYKIPPDMCSVRGGCMLYTREKPQTEGVSAEGILSNKLHGIDNTGNVCVWASESVLLHTILTSETLRGAVKGKHVLELGGGMTALCGLGLATVGECDSVVLTDGHPDCVANQRVCLQMTRQHAGGPGQGGSLNRVKCEQMRWSKDDILGDVTRVMNIVGGRLFDVIVVADCLFFRDFHDDLLWVLRRCLSQLGVVLLLQPRRADSMQLFLEKAGKTFHVSIEEDYNDDVVEMVGRYKENALKNGFDTDLHAPVLVTLQRKEAEADSK